MLTDLDAAQCCFDTYWATGKLTRTLDISGVFVGIREREEGMIICFRGSTTLQDWERDFQAQMIIDPDLGGVHPGFIEGMRDVFGELPPDPDKSIMITGHSLGAARAWIYAGLLAEHDTIMQGDRIVVFGSPLPGAQKLTDILALCPKKAYKNRHDPVCDVPFDIPLVDPYVHPCQNTRLNIMPADSDPWGAFSDHHFELYLKGIQDAQTA